MEYTESQLGKAIESYFLKITKLKWNTLNLNLENPGSEKITIWGTKLFMI